MDPRPLAPDEKEAATLVDDFLAAQLAPRTRATYATDLALFQAPQERIRSHPERCACGSTPSPGHDVPAISGNDVPAAIS